MKRLISLAVAVMLITLLGVCRSRAYDEYNLTDLAACSSVKSDSNGKGGFVCAFSGNTVFSARLVPDFSAYSFSVGGRIRSVSQSGNYTYALVFDDAFTNKYSVYSLNLDNGNVSQNTFVDENFMTDSFSVTDNRIYYIKTDSLKSYVACRDFSSDKKSKITFSDNVNEVFNNNGKSYARLCDGSIYKLSQSSSTYVADTGEFKNIYNAGINRVINEDGFIVSLSDNSRNYVSNATAENVSVSDGKIYSAVNYRLNLKTSEKHPKKQKACQFPTEQLLLYLTKINVLFCLITERFRYLVRLILRKRKQVAMTAVTTITILLNQIFNRIIPNTCFLTG